MPTHWESSTRPLFVKTVLVNGGRHAILTQEDPLGQVNKFSRPTSPHGSNSSGDSNAAQNSNNKKGFTGQQGKNKQPLDLQGCLVKLRVVLATHQETRRQSSNLLKSSNGPPHRKRKHYSKNRSSSLDKKDDLLPDIPQTSPKVIPETKHQLSIDQSVAVANFFTEPKPYITVNENAERISGSSNERWNRSITDTCCTVPLLGVSTNYDVSWNTVPSDNYFTRPFYNRLSERVLQWLDLSARTSQKSETENTTTQRQENKRSTPVPRRVLQRMSSEDNSDEVRTDEDVETALSMEVPKFTQELNRRHKINLTPRPQDESSFPLLQAETYRSFTNIRTGKCALPPKIESLLHRRVKRRGHLTKQVRLEDSSDEEKCDNLWNFPEEHSTEAMGASSHDGGLWSGRSEGKPRTNRDGKPQLHIFMPSIPQEEQLSDVESESAKSEQVFPEEEQQMC